MDIEKGPFETFGIVEVAMNNDEVAMNNDNHEVRKPVTKSANKEKIILQIKSICSC